MSGVVSPCKHYDAVGKTSLKFSAPHAKLSADKKDQIPRNVLRFSSCGERSNGELKFIRKMKSEALNNSK